MPDIRSQLFGVGTDTDPFAEQRDRLLNAMSDPNLSLEDIQSIKYALNTAKTNQRMAMEIGDAGGDTSGIGEKLLRGGLNTLGTVGRTLDTPAREVVRRPVLKLLGSPAAETEDASFIDALKEAGAPNWVSYPVGFTGDAVADPLLLFSPLKLLKGAGKFGQVGGKALTAAGNLAKNAMGEERMLQAVAEGLPDAAKWFDRGGTQFHIPFTNIEKTLVPLDTYKKGAAALTFQLEKTEIGSKLVDTFQQADHWFTKKFRTSTGDYHADAIKSQLLRDEELGAKVASEGIQSAFAPITKVGFLSGRENTRTYQAMTHAMEDLNGFNPGVRAIEVIEGEKTLADALPMKGLRTPEEFQRFFDNPKYRPKIKEAVAKRLKEFGSSADADRVVDALRDMRMQTSDMYQRLVDAGVTDAGFYEAFIQHSFRLGWKKSGMHELKSVADALIKSPAKSGRIFQSIEDAMTYIRSVAKENGIPIPDLDKYLSVETDALKLHSAYMLAGERALAQQQYLNAMKGLAKRGEVVGQGELTGLKLLRKVAPDAAELPNPHRGIIEITKDNAETLLGGEGTGDIRRVLTEPGLSVTKIGGREFIGPERHINALNDLAAFDSGGQFRSEVMGWLGKLSRPTMAFKRGVTQPWPSFHFRNGYSDWARQAEDHLLEVVNPKTEIAAFNIFRGVDGMWTTKTGKDIPFAEIRDKFYHLLQGFHVERGDYTQRVVNEVKQAAARKGDLTHAVSLYMGTMEKFGTLVENHGKMVGFLANLKNGLDFEDAAARTFRFHFNYQMLTNAEKKIKTIVPFYAWQRKATAHILSQLLESPGSQATILRGMHNLEKLPSTFGLGPELTDDQRASLPEFIQEGTAIPFWASALVQGGMVRMISGIDLTQGEMDKLAFFGATNADGVERQLKQMAAMLNPFIKLPLELASGEDFFFGTPTRDLSRTTAGGRKVYQYRPKEAPLGIEALKDPQMKKLFELAAMGLSGIPGLGALAATGRISSEYRKVKETAAAFGGDDTSNKVLSALDLLAGVKSRELDLQQLQRRKTTGDIHAANELLRTERYRARTAAGQ